MKQRFLIKIALVLALTPTFTGWAQTPEKWWERANSAYTGGDYPEAILHYDSIRAQGYVSARLYYNLANAYYKDNQIGKAILNYNKALRLDPGNDDIKHNLAIANSYVRDRIDTVPEFFLKTWARELMYRAGTDSWAVMNLVFFALALALVLVYLLGRRMSWRKAGF
ncbi:MAG: tetratricopeptide repeat protein [Rikenellaceae bacterium]|nr:tetratricopeptide repeat protein [Rikenellaceae bacterium]